MSLKFNNLPQHWDYKNIIDVCRVISGYGFPKKYQGRREGPYPFFKVGDIAEAWKNDIRYIKKANHHINQDDILELRYTPLPKGTIVFAKIGAAIALNRRAILGVEALVDNNVMGLFPINEIILGDYLYYFTLTLKLEKLSRATTVPSLRKSDVESIKIPLPPIFEQESIIKKLDELFSQLKGGLTSLQRTKILLNQYRQAVLKAAMTGELTKEWRKKHQHELEPASVLLEHILRERRQKWGEERLAKFQAQGRTPKDDKWKYKFPKYEPIDQLNIPKYWTKLKLKDITFKITDVNHKMQKAQKHGIPLISAKDIKEDGTINFSNKIKYISEADFKDMSVKIRPQIDDIIYTRYGTIGRVAVVKDKHPKKFQVSYSCAFIRFPRNLVSIGYYSKILQSAPLYTQAISGIQGSTIPDLGLQTISDFVIPLPPLKEQFVINKILEAKLSVLDKIKKDMSYSLRIRERLKNSILKAAFGGKLIQESTHKHNDSQITNSERGASTIIKTTQVKLNGWKKNE
jgi:type I restriction enzyme S subunit